MKQVKYVERIQVNNNSAFFFEVIIDRANNPYLRISQVQEDHNGIPQRTILQLPKQSEHQFKSAFNRSYEMIKRAQEDLDKEIQQLKANSNAWKPKAS